MSFNYLFFLFVKFIFHKIQSQQEDVYIILYIHRTILLLDFEYCFIYFLCCFVREGKTLMVSIILESSSALCSKRVSSAKAMIHVYVRTRFST